MAIRDIDGVPAPSKRKDKDLTSKLHQAAVCCAAFKSNPGSPKAKGQAIGNHTWSSDDQKVCAEQNWWASNLGRLTQAITDHTYDRIEFEISSEPCERIGPTQKPCRILIREDLYAIVKNAAVANELVVFVIRTRVFYAAQSTGGWRSGSY